MSLLAPEGPVFFSGTFNGWILGMRAAQETLRILEAEKVPERVNARGEDFAKQINNGIGRTGIPACVLHWWSHWWMFFGSSPPRSYRDVIHYHSGGGYPVNDLVISYVHFMLAKRIRLGVLSDFLYSIEVDPVVRQVIESALVTFNRLGARLIEVSIPHIDEAVVAAPLVVLADAAAYHQKWLRDRGSEYVFRTRNMLRLGELILATDYLRALHIRGRLKLAMKEVFDAERLSALVMPCLAHSSEPLVESRHEDNESDGHEFMAWNRNCIPFNSTGQPAITLPAGFDDHGVPVGLQIVGRPFDETTVLRIAQAYETATPWHLESAPDIVATN